MDSAFNTYGQKTSQVISRNEYGQPTHVRDITGNSGFIKYTPMGHEFAQFAQTGAHNLSYLAANDSNCPSGTAYVAINKAIDQVESRECFDVLGRKIRGMTRAFEGTTWVFEDVQYDALGRMARQSEPFKASGASSATHWTTFEYDILGRVVKTHLPDGSTGETEYDGFTTTTINDEGHRRSETLDALGSRAEVFDNTGLAGASHSERPRVRYEYDAHDNLVAMYSVLQPGESISGSGSLPGGGNGFTTTIEYDALGRKLSMSDPDKGDWTYKYNAYGELISQTSANQVGNGASTTMSYDSLGRMVARIDYTAQNAEEGETTWQYNNTSSGNSVGQLETVSYTGTAYRDKQAAANTVIPDVVET